MNCPKQAVGQGRSLKLNNTWSLVRNISYLADSIHIALSHWGLRTALPGTDSIPSHHPLILQYTHNTSYTTCLNTIMLRWQAINFAVLACKILKNFSAAFVFA